MEGIKLLERLCAIPAISGDERELSEFIISELRVLCAEVYTDLLGNIIAHFGVNGGVKTALVTHIDEPGFMVKGYDDFGDILFDPVGEWDYGCLLGKRVLLRTSSGEFPGVIGSKPVHLITREERRKPPEGNELYGDFGFLTRAEAASTVALGDYMAIARRFVKLGADSVSASGIFDRIGAFAILSLLSNLKKEGVRPDTDLWCVFSVRENAGLDSTTTALESINPVRVIAVVGSEWHSPPEGTTGNGIILPFMSGRTIFDKKLTRSLCEICESKGIRYSTDEIKPRGRTYPSLMASGSGASASAVCIPVQFARSGFGVCRCRDALDCVKLLLSFAG